MSQPPKYANSPSWDIRKLLELLNELERYSFIHEDLFWSVSLVMNELYLSEVEGNQDFGGEESSDFPGFEEESYRPGELFHLVPVKSRQQYVQDLRNLIGYFLAANSLSTSGVAQEIVSMRDIACYNQHVVDREDTEFLEKNKSKRRSVWFHGDTKPRIEGIYEISWSSDEPRHSGFAYWDGRSWHRDCIMFDECVSQPKSDDYLSSQDYCWRGFVERSHLY